MLKNLFIAATLTWSCLFSRSPASSILTESNLSEPKNLPEMPALNDSLQAAINSAPLPKPPMSAVDPGPKILILPANHDIRLEISYPFEDTLGFDIKPMLRVQVRYELNKANSDWYDLRSDIHDRDESDYFLANGTTVSAARDTLTIRLSRIMINDPYLEATWYFRFRLEFEGKLSPWNEIGPVRLIGINRLGVPRRPTIKIL